MITDFPDKGKDDEDAGSTVMRNPGQGHEGNKKSPAESHPLRSVLRRQQVCVTASPAASATLQLAPD